jgi:hypothetical protein
MHPERGQVSSPRFAWLVALTTVVVLAAHPAILRAEATVGQRAYLEGIRAYEIADYSTAVARMREALKTDRSEGLRKFRATGFKEEDYLPHFFLGLSLEKSGAREEALAELRESERQGAIRGKASSVRLLEAALSRLTPPPTRVPEVPAAVATPTAAVPTAPPAVIPTVPEVSRESRPTVPTVGRVPSPVQVRPTAPTTSTLSRPTASPAAVPVPADSLGERRASLREGLRAFFRAEYRQAAMRLEPLGAMDPMARRFLAFSLAGQYILGGRRDAALLSRARSEHEKAVASGDGLPSPELIPEAIRDALRGR